MSRAEGAFLILGYLSYLATLIAGAVQAELWQETLYWLTWGWLVTGLVGGAWQVLRAR